MNRQRFGWWQIGALVIGTVLASVAVTVWLVVAYVFPRQFEPVSLSDKEALILDTKLTRINFPFDRPMHPVSAQDNPDQLRAPVQGRSIEPEPYTEEHAGREIHFTERELNALLARNTDLAHKLAIDLAEDLASAKLLVSFDDDFPLLGAKTVKVTAGLGLAYAEGRPIVIMKGVSVWGVPVPNAWLGGIKNVDLVREFGENPGFWQSFAGGIDDIRVLEGELRIRLKE